MKLTKVTKLLADVKIKLESLEPSKIAEQVKASEQNPARLNGARKRLELLYSRLSAGRPADTKVQATGSKR